VKILLHQYNAVIGHCREEEGRGVEACGILYGPAHPRTITDMLRMENVHEHPRYRWQFDPKAQVDTWVGLDRQGMRPWVIYHSHLDTDPIMSDDDERYAANDPSIAHLIVSLSARTSRLWVATHTYTRELPFEVIGDPWVGERVPAEFD
jgi:proteasome lid subunit RPN8/RPN11